MTKRCRLQTLLLPKDMAKDKSISTVPLMEIRQSQSKSLRRMTSFTSMATSVKELKTARLIRISL